MKTTWSGDIAPECLSVCSFRACDGKAKREKVLVTETISEPLRPLRRELLKHWALIHRSTQVSVREVARCAKRGGRTDNGTASESRRNTRRPESMAGKAGTEAPRLFAASTRAPHNKLIALA